MLFFTNRKYLLGFGALVVLGLAGCILSVGDREGARADGERLDRMRASPQWSEGDERFANPLPRIDGSWVEMTARFFFGGAAEREPDQLIRTVRPSPEALAESPSSGLRVTWFGHSSLLVEVDGVRTLVDPVWSERASPFTWAGPKRFYAPPLPLDELPPLDAVVISHDHYDHLDRDTVEKLAERELVWLVPLGVGAHLEAWGVPVGRIVELDWWESYTLGQVTLTATPARHFSGRSIFFGDQNATLWSGWAWVGPTKRAFYSGDTALHSAFEEIGTRLGPFDLTLMEAGAYNELWCDVHLGPEQAVLAHQLVSGGVMLPVHWGLFDLALHGWTEPAERIAVAAEKLGASVLFLPPGGTYVGGQDPSQTRWWPEVPWQAVDEAPAWSTAVESLQVPLRRVSEERAP